MRPMLKQSKLKKLVQYFRNFNTKLESFLFSDNGILWNLITILVNLIGIIAIPLIYTLALIWSLQQMGVINSDIYAPVFHIDAVFASSSNGFWIKYLDYNILLYVICALDAIFIITGILEFV
jgi:hypothetical protein